jgi:DNA-binding transcriptional regulator YhcF (GntR family)
MFKRELFFQHIARILRKEIRDQYKPGQKIPGDSDLAKRFDVSVVTVRQAVMLLLSEGMLERRQGSGTRVSEYLPPQHIALYTEQDILDRRLSDYVPNLFRSFRDFFEERYETRVYMGRRNLFYDGQDVPTASEREMTCPAFKDAINQYQLQGVVSILADSSDTWPELAREQGIVCVGSMQSGVDQVTPDRDLAIRQAVERLAQRGCKRIAMLDWFNSGQDKVETLANSVRCGFREALQAQGLAFVPQWVCGDIHPGPEHVGWQAFREIWSAHHHKPDALIVADDMLFTGVVQAIDDIGISVPDAMAVSVLTSSGINLYAPFVYDRGEFGIQEYTQKLGGFFLERLEGYTGPHRTHWLEPTWQQIQHSQSATNSKANKQSIDR